MMTTKSCPCNQPGRRGTPAMRPWFLSVVAVLMVAAITTDLATGDGLHRRDADRDDGHDRHGRSPYAIGLWGDMPYSDLQATVGVPNLLADMNAQDLTFTVHDGDLKAGNGIPGSTTPTTCSDALYTQALNFFNA